MIAPHSRPAAARESESSPRRHAPAPDAPTQAARPNPTGATIQSLVAHSASHGRGNRTVRATAIQQMQRTSGNRAVQRLLARRSGPVTPPSSGLRGAVSIQRNGTGLASAGAVGQFATNIKAPLATWDSYGDDLEKRQRALFEPATKQLEALGAPRITSLLKDDRLGDESTYAAFMPATWMVLIKPSGLRANASDDAKARLAGTIYHEIRHAEQYYRIARMLAGKGAEQELSTLGLRADVIAHARKNPLSPPQQSKQSKNGPTEQQREYQEAEAWYAATTRYHDMSVKLDETRDNYYAAKATQDTDPERYKAAWLQYRQAYKLYQSTAVEADAWAVGGVVESTLGFKPNTLETELAKMPADPRTFKPIGAATSTPQPPMRPRALGTGALPDYKPQLAGISPSTPISGADVNSSIPASTSDSPGSITTSTPPVRVPRKLGGFSPLTPLDPSTISATDEVPLTPQVRQGRKLGGFSPLTPLDPSTIGAIETQVPDLDDSPSGGAIPSSTPQIPTPSNIPRRPRLGVFSPRPASNPSTSNMTGPETSDLAAPILAGNATSGGAISTSTPPFVPPVRRGRQLGAFSPLTPLDPNTISAADTPDTTPPSGPTGGPRRDDEDPNLQLTVQRHAMPEDLAQALTRQQIPQEELTAKG
jgi:hypothetical protein